MPNIKVFSEFITFADKKNLPLTILTPVMTNQGIEHCTGLFDKIYQWNSDTEVVVNDIGVLFFLKKNTLILNFPWAGFSIKDLKIHV